MPPILPMTCAIAVMAKAPRPGRCKTRLCPPLSPDQAASLSRAFLQDITENLFAAARHVPIVPYVAFAPAGDEALFDGILAARTQLVLADGSGAMPAGVEGFGRSLLHAVQALLAAGHTSVCVLNADSPTLPTAILRRAAEILAAPGDRAVMAPADDGGYTLLGMKAPHAALFTDIAWSTDGVAAQTRNRARVARIDLVELPTWYDVDDHAALSRLVGEVSGTGGGAYAAPHTASCLRDMGYAEPRRAAC